MLSWLLFSLFERRQLNFLYFQKIDDDGQKMAKAAMALYGIDQNPLRRGNCSSFGQPSTCNSPRAALRRRATALLRPAPPRDFTAPRPLRPVRRGGLNHTRVLSAKAAAPMPHAVVHRARGA